MYTDDPIADFHRHDARQERELARLPKCSDCTKRIQDDEFYIIQEIIYCPNCLNKNFRVWTDDYISE